MDGVEPESIEDKCDIVAVGAVTGPSMRSAGDYAVVKRLWRLSLPDREMVSPAILKFPYQYQALSFCYPRKSSRWIQVKSMTTIFSMWPALD